MPLPFPTLPPAVLVAAFFLTSPATAGETAWIDPTNGTFATPERWTFGVPTCTDHAIFGENAGRPFVVTVTNDEVVGLLSVVNQHWTLDLSAGSGFASLGATVIAKHGRAPAQRTISHGDFSSLAGIRVVDEFARGQSPGAIVLDTVTVAIHDLCVLDGDGLAGPHDLVILLGAWSGR